MEHELYARDALYVPIADGASSHRADALSMYSGVMVDTARRISVLCTYLTELFMQHRMGGVLVQLETVELLDLHQACGTPAR